MPPDVGLPWAQFLGGGGALCPGGCQPQDQEGHDWWPRPALPPRAPSFPPRGSPAAPAPGRVWTLPAPTLPVVVSSELPAPPQGLGSDSPPPPVTFHCRHPLPPGHFQGHEGDLGGLCRLPGWWYWAGLGPEVARRQDKGGPSITCCVFPTNSCCFSGLDTLGSI